MTVALPRPRPTAVSRETVIRDQALPFAGLMKVALVVAYIGTTVLEPKLGGNLAMVDPLIGLFCLGGLISMTRVGSHATACLARALPWMWLILVGSLIGMAHVGVAGWAVESLVQTTLALLTFFCFWHLIETFELQDTARMGVVLALIAATLALVLTPYRWRADGYFPNPNYPGHFGVLAAGLLLSIGTTRMKWIAVVCGAVVLWTTASFGAMAMVVVMGVVTVGRAIERHTLMLAVFLVGMVIAGALFIFAPRAEVESSSSGTWEVKGVISEERFEKSQGSRFERWGPALDAFADEPWGQGPNGIANRVIVDGKSFEVHSDPIGFLVERGVIGMTGLIGFIVVIWRSAPRFGVTRLLFAACIVSGLFRETIHYRHMWMILALAMAVDFARARSQGSADEPADGSAAAAVTDRYPAPVTSA